MSTNARIDLALLLGTMACVLFIVNSGRDLSQPNVEYMPDMAYSPAAESFSANTVFANGMTLQVPPRGAVARGRLPLRYGPGPEEALRAGRELTSPVPPDDESAAARGAEGFGVFCQPCHGPTGAGDGPVAMRGFPPPPSLFTEKARALPDGQIFHIVTYGQGNMPAHGAQIPPEQRWEITAHLRELQRRAAERAAEEARTQAEAAAAAEAVDTRNQEEAGS